MKVPVAPRPGVSLSEAEAIAHRARPIASYKKPHSLEFTPEPPNRASGKILERELRGRHGAGRDRIG